MNSSSRNGARVIWLAVHTTEGMMRVQTLRDWTAWPGSSHAASDETGALWGPAQGFVPYDRAAWTLRNGNRISENIEQCGWARWTRAEWLARPKLLDATARWLAERSAARGIPLRRLTHAEIRARVPGVLGHGDYSTATGDGTHWDPGPGYPWDVVLAKANAYRDGIPQEDDMPTAREVAEELLNYPLKRIGGDQPGKTITLRNIIEWDDAVQDNTVARVVDPLREEIAELRAAVEQLAARIES